jgi:carboxypeptidase family protein
MDTRRLVTARGVLSLVLSLALATVPVLTTVRAAQPAAGDEAGHGSIHGTLFGEDEKTPLQGGKVTAINVRTGKQYSSEVTTGNGSYDISGLPAGTYDVVIEAAGNLFVADHIQDIGPGESVGKSYSVQPQRPANRMIPKLPAPQGSATIVGESEAKAPFWGSTGGKVLIGVLAAGAAAAIYNNTKSNNNASPSSP